jgi:mitochondrial ATPase complex subunit ATP10
MMIAATTRRLASQSLYRCHVWSSVTTIVHNSFSTDQKSKRVDGICVNPESIGSQILPGGRSVVKKDRKGDFREVMVERAYGHFWMISDLAKVGKKPTLASVIPEEHAQEFPFFSNFSVLSTDETVDVPTYFLRDNRANDPSAQCTLVAIAYKDHGYKLLPSWTDPFEAAYGVGNPRAKAMRLTITEGKFTKMLLSGFIKRNFRKSTSPELQSQTLLCFGPEDTTLLQFNDALRMHNTLTGYVFLLDGLGRVRFAGSGEASEDEAKQLVQLAAQLTPRLAETKLKHRAPFRDIKKYY